MKITVYLALSFLFVNAACADSDHFWLNGEINGQPLRFLFDTGAEGSALFPRTLKRLGLEGEVLGEAPPSANGKIHLGQTSLVDVKFAGTTFRTRFGVLPRDLSPFDVQQDGTIGWPQMSGNILIVEAATVTLWPTSEVIKDAATWMKFPILTNYNILAFEIPGPGTNELVVTVDTGKSLGLTLSSDRWNQWKAAHPDRPKTLTTYYMFGSGNVLKDESWADEIALGPFVLRDVPVMEANHGETVLGSTGYAATLGMAALKRLDLVVDGKHGFAYIRPKLSPPAPYDHNRLGAVFNQDGAKGIELLAHVAPGSPAAEAGVRDGDILLKAGDHDMVNLATNPELVPLVLGWHRPAGTQFVLTLMRGSDVFKTTVTLRDILKPAKSLPVPADKLAGEVRLLEILGVSAIQATNYDHAIDNYTEALRIDPKAAEAFSGRATAYGRKGSNSLAVADLSEALRLEPGNAEALHNRGFFEELAGQWDKAMADFTEAIKHKPDFTRALVDRGLIYQKNGDRTRAASDFTEAIRVEPNFAEAFRARGAIYLLTNDFNAAIKDLNEANRLAPGDVETLGNRGIAYRQTGAFDPAIADLTECLRLAGDKSEILMHRGYAYAYKGELKKAIEDFDRAIVLDPKNAGAFAGRANVYYAAKDYARAVADYDKVARTVSDDPALFGNRGRAFAAEGKIDEAIADFTQAIKLDPASASTFESRGDCYLKEKEYTRAFSDYEKACQIQPGGAEQNAKFAYALATCPDDHFRDGKKALQYAQKACEVTNWKDLAAINVLAMAYAANGDFSNAIKWQQNCLDSTLSAEERTSALGRLKLYQQNKPYLDTSGDGSAGK